MKGRLFFFLLVTVIVCFSCRNSSGNNDEFVFPEADSVPLGEAEKLSAEAIEDISKKNFLN